MKVRGLVLAITLVVSSMGFMSCDSDGVDARNNTFQVDIGGDAFKATGINAYWTDFSDGNFNAYGLSDDITIYVGFDDPNAGEGSYTIGNDVFVYLTYSSGANYSSLVQGSSGTVQIVEKNAEDFKGSFEVTVVNFDDPSDKIELKNGSFNVQYR